MTDHKPLPRCPYCGEHMCLEYNSKSVYWYECYKCGATTPTEEAEQAAYEAAMNRWQEPNRVLTLEEVREYCKQGAGAAPLWVGFQNVPRVSRWMVVCNPEEVCSNDAVRNYCGGIADMYNKTWRCWLRKPTAEEMESTPWESKKEDEK